MTEEHIRNQIARIELWFQTACLGELMRDRAAKEEELNKLRKQLNDKQT